MLRPSRHQPSANCEVRRKTSPERSSPPPVPFFAFVPLVSKAFLRQQKKAPEYSGAIERIQLARCGQARRFVVGLSQEPKAKSQKPKALLTLRH